MIREILFRGRRIDNGKWIMGSLCEAENHTYIVYDMDFYVAKTCTGDALTSDRFYEVDPATVGQFTGLSDKHDCWIFEGDKVKTFNGLPAIIKHGEHRDTDILDSNEEFYFDADGDERMSYGFYADAMGECISLDNRTDKWLEIIGTIHDKEVSA